MNKPIVLLPAFLMMAAASNAQLTITSLTPQNAVQNSLLGAGVSVSNITYQGVPNSLAGFSGASNLGISTGIILCTGNTAPIGSGASFFVSDGASGAGDSTLQAISMANIQDAAVLEFDFQVASDSVRFNFVFASEEYSDYVNSAFNDIFGFFISGPGIIGQQNIALVPGTVVPVAINNVNNGYSTVGMIPTGPCVNCTYYQDNTNGTSVAFDGMTTVLTAISAVQPCTVYHIKLAIANVGDGAFDSGVFLESNSFQACGPVTVYNGLAPVADTLWICPGETIQLNCPVAPNYTWSNGETTQSITVNQPGTYTVSISSGMCQAASEMVTVALDSSLAKPVLSQNGPLLQSSVTDSLLVYEWYLNGTPVPNSNAPQFQVSTGGCYKLLVSKPDGCSVFSDSVCLNFAGIMSPEGQPIPIDIRPNPSTGGVTIFFSNPGKDAVTITVYDIAGKEVRTASTNQDHLYLEALRLDSGLFMVRLEYTGTGRQGWTKLVRY